MFLFIYFLEKGRIEEEMDNLVKNVPESSQRGGLRSGSGSIVIRASPTAIYFRELKSVKLEAQAINNIAC